MLILLFLLILLKLKNSKISKKYLLDSVYDNTMDLLFDLEPAEIDLLLWVLHFKDGYSYESISKAVNLPSRKVRYFADRHENIRLDKLLKFKNDLIQYSKDQERLKKSFWKIKMRVGAWNPIPNKPIEPDFNSNLHVIEEKRMKLIEKLDKKRKSRKKPTQAKVERVDPDADVKSVLTEIAKKIFK